MTSTIHATLSPVFCLPTTRLLPNPQLRRRARSKGERAPLSGLLLDGALGDGWRDPPSLPPIYVGLLSCTTSGGWLGKAHHSPVRDLALNAVMARAVRCRCGGFWGALRTPSRLGGVPLALVCVFPPPPPGGGRVERWVGVALPPWGGKMWV